MTASVDPAVEGEQFIIGKETNNPGRTFVRPKCDLNTGRWYCIIHDEGFANQFQKDSHIHDGTHRLAWVCTEHGPEVP